MGSPQSIPILPAARDTTTNDTPLTKANISMKQTLRPTHHPTPIHSTPSSLTESTIHDTWKGLPDSQIRARGLRLSPDTLADIIPHGPYCYTVLDSLPSPQIGHHIRPCIFLKGMRPDTICLINPARDFSRDLFNLDACKRCGINDHDGLPI